MAIWVQILPNNQFALFGQSVLRILWGRRVGSCCDIEAIRKRGTIHGLLGSLSIVSATRVAISGQFRYLVIV